MSEAETSVVVSLLPCPFCGATAKRITPMGEWRAHGYEPDGVRYVCGALYETPARRCPGVVGFYGENAEAEAIAAWNTRLTSTPQAASADVREAWPGRNLDLAKARVTVLGKLGLMLSVMAGGQAAEADGYDAADLYSEVLMALAIEDAEDPDIALEIARDHPEGDTLVDALAAVPAHVPSAGEVVAWLYTGTPNGKQWQVVRERGVCPAGWTETPLFAAATTGNADAPVPFKRPRMSAEEWSALPENARRYIMMLETDCDLSGTIRSEMILRDQVEALEQVANEGKWHCTCCHTEFAYHDDKRPNCPTCKALDQYTYPGTAPRAALATPVAATTGNADAESGS